jgi:hypothetical protein
MGDFTANSTNKHDMQNETTKVVDFLSYTDGILEQLYKIHGEKEIDLNEIEEKRINFNVFREKMNDDGKEVIVLHYYGYYKISENKIKIVDIEKLILKKIKQNDDKMIELRKSMKKNKREIIKNKIKYYSMMFYTKCIFPLYVILFNLYKLVFVPIDIICSIFIFSYWFIFIADKKNIRYPNILEDSVDYVHSRYKYFVHVHIIVILIILTIIAIK